jgi:hypothetical protein
MRVTRDFGRGLIVAMLVSQLPFSALALTRLLRDDAPEIGRRRAPRQMRATIRAGLALHTLSVSIGRLASRAHSPIEPS